MWEVLLCDGKSLLLLHHLAGRCLNTPVGGDLGHCLKTGATKNRYIPNTPQRNFWCVVSREAEIFLKIMTDIGITLICMRLVCKSICIGDS